MLTPKWAAECPEGEVQMDAENIAAWMQKEYRRVQELVQRLRERLPAPTAGGRAEWLDEVRDRFDHLRAHQIKHMALEEEGGYMQPVLEQRPTLAPQVERLHQEHRELMAIMNSIHEALHQLTANDSLQIMDVYKRIENYLGYLDHHEESENLLVSSVFTEDMGSWHSAG
jgi:hemerythrin-like domain-containing protein